MKEYNIKTITDNDELKIVFKCDKDNNEEYNKKNYNGYCNHTTNSKYMKARQRNKKLTDKELVVSLENEIEHYRDKINLLEIIHQEKVKYINQQDELIKEYQEVFKEIVFDGKDILNIKTPNQIRKLLGYNPIKTKESNECLDKEFEITINNEDYLIKYKSNTDTVMLNTYLTKLVNEKDKIMICKDNQFRIINKTRDKIKNLFMEE